MSMMHNDATAAIALHEAARHLSAGDQEGALQILQQLITQQPLHGEAFAALSDLCSLLRRWELLTNICRQRLQHLPNDTETCCRYAQAELGQRHYLRAVALLEGVVRRAPGHAAAWHELGRVMKRLARLDEALDCFHRAETADPGNRIFQDSLLFTQLFSDACSPEKIAAAHRAWGRNFSPVTWPEALWRDGDRITVGYLSPDFREHSVASFIEPVLHHHNRHRFKIICYQCGPEQDATTKRLCSMVENWRDITDLDDASAYDLIVRDGVTLLVDLAGHTAWNRLPLMALRPAPIQLTWIGYPHSTGLTQIDYRITDTVADPPGLSESLHTEHVVRLPACFLCYTPPADAPQPAIFSPIQQSGVITFGCFNNLAKITPTLLDCWRSLLDQVPQSRLLIKGEALDDPAAQAELLKRFGLPENRVLACGWTPDRISHLALYNQVDIALDTWPYNGTTTTCEALWMGVPVVTLTGTHHASRVGASLLTSAGLEFCVCQSAEEYVQRAAELAGNLPLLQTLRRNLRAMLSASPLMDGSGFTQKLEKLYCELVSTNSAQ